MRATEFYKKSFEEILALPLPKGVLLECNLAEKFFYLDLPIYTAKAAHSLPSSIKKYIAAREGKTFRPQKTSFRIEKGRRVILRQKIPFSQEVPAPCLRELLRNYALLARRCRKTFLEIAEEEARQEAFRSLAVQSI